MSRITGLKRGKTREKRYDIYLDGKRAANLLAATVLKAKLREGQDVTDERLKAVVEADTLQRCRNAAVRLLGYRPRSEQEIRRRLARRGFAANNIEDTVARLKEQGLIDDSAFARFWQENRREFSPRSKSLTGLELKRKGLNAETIAQATGGLDDRESAYRAALAKARRLNAADFKDFRQRLGGFLGRRGFAYGVIDETVKRLWREQHAVKT